MRAWMVLGLLTACSGGGGAADSGEEDDSVDTQDTYVPCEATEIRFDGPEAPRVGDTWTLTMWCDGALMTGAVVIRFDPADFATIDDNEVTFQYAGTAELMMQMGTYREYLDVTVVQ